MVKHSSSKPKTQEAKTSNLKRGEVWLVATRPCLIISPAEIHNYLRTAIAAPMTTGGSAAPFRISVHFQGKSGLILLDQIRALDKTRLVRCLGAIDQNTLNTTLLKLQEMFAE